MKKTILLFTLILLNIFVSAQSLNDQYSITISKVHRFYNQKNADSLYALYSDNMKAALSLDKTIGMINALSDQIGKLNSTTISSITKEQAVYKGSFDKMNLNIFIKLNADNKLNALSFRPIKTEAELEETPIYTNNYNITTDKGDTLYGTLSLPQQLKDKFPIILMIAGSGPTDRDGNNKLGVQSNTFKMLADSFSKAGIACVRFDKRGVGASENSASNEEDIRFEDLVNDVVFFVQKIKKDPRFNKVIIAGHSEGSLIGMLAARKVNIDKFISISGPGEDAGTLLSRQIKTANPSNATEGDRIINALKKGKTIEITDKNFNALFRSSVQPYLISWFAYDPRIEIKKLNIPILILQGNTDLQVNITDAQNLSKAQPKARLIIIDQMNHVLKTVGSNKEENAASYNNPSLPVDADLTKAMIDFCLL